MYKFLKPFTMVALPMVTAINIVAASTWHLTIVVSLAMTVINACLGAFVLTRESSGKEEYDGQMAITGNDPDTGIPDLKLTLTCDPSDFIDKTRIVLKSIDERQLRG